MKRDKLVGKESVANTIYICIFGWIYILTTMMHNFEKKIIVKPDSDTEETNTKTENVPSAASLAI